MRKRLYITASILGIGLFLFSGCGNTGDKDAPVRNTETEEVEEVDVFDYDVNDYVTLGEYKNLSVRYPVPQISREDLEMETEYLLEENIQYNEIPDRAIEDGDYVNIDFTGTIDGEEFEGGSATEYEFTLGTEEFIEDFEKNLIGKKPKDNFSFKITFPEDYDETLGGKEAEFNVTVNSVSEVIVPEYNDDFIKEVTEYNTVKEYEEATMEELMAGASDEAMSNAGEDALLMAVANATINGSPQALYESCYESRMQEYQGYADMFGVEIDEFIGDEQDFEDEITEWVNEILVAQAIAQKEGFDNLDENYEVDAGNLAVEFGYDSLEEFESDYGEVYVKVNLIKEKALDFLFGNANVEEVSEEEYYNEDDESLGEFEEVTDTEI